MKKPIPRGGGIPLFIGVLVASLIFLPMTKIIIAILIAAFVSLVVGVVDDKYDISPYLRFVSKYCLCCFCRLFWAPIFLLSPTLWRNFIFKSLQLPFLARAVIYFLWPI